MVTDLVLGLVLGILTPVVDALPVGNLPVSATGGFFGDVHAALIAVDQWIPILGPITFFAGVLVASFGGLLLYRSGLFIYRLVRG